MILFNFVSWMPWVSVDAPVQGSHNAHIGAPGRSLVIHGCISYAPAVRWCLAVQLRYLTRPRPRIPPPSMAPATVIALSILPHSRHHGCRPALANIVPGSALFGLLLSLQSPRNTRQSIRLVEQLAGWARNRRAFSAVFY